MDVKLVMFRPNGQRKDFSLKKPVTVIGRGEKCDLRIPIEPVSRRHCELMLSGSQLKVKDLASSNGTYVNNRRVNEIAMHAGDRLTVGFVVFTVQIDGVPEQIHPTKASGKKAGAGKEEVIELEADVVGAGGSAADELATDMGGTSDDPISALEALAAESTKKPGKKKS
jgi:pSer/pThr/pTyr-binding forkhead associated (FHA) protein